MIDEILNLEEFKAKPPVLIDIGASGKLFDSWRQIAKILKSGMHLKGSLMKWVWTLFIFHTPQKPVPQCLLKP